MEPRRTPRLPVLYLLAFDHRGSFEQLVGDATLVPGASG
jgi:hypothetical protein